MGKLAVISLVFAVVFTTMLGIFGGVNAYRTNRDVEAWRYRAEVASNAADMAVYLDHMLHGLEERGLTHGYCSMFWPRPDNNLALSYVALVNMQKRAVSLSKFEQDEVIYQVGLDDLRGTLREFDSPSFHCVIVARHQWVILGWWLVAILWVVGLITGSVWISSDY